MPATKIILFIFLVAILAVCAGCTSPTATIQPSQQPSPTIQPSQQPTALPATGETVTIKNLAFSPEVVTIPVHGNVTWTNDDGFGHTIMFTGEPARTLDAGSSYVRTFDTPGTYDYICSIHPSMKGKVVVK